jgi:hypothetical protein
MFNLNTLNKAAQLKPSSWSQTLSRQSLTPFPTPKKNDLPVPLFKK